MSEPKASGFKKQVCGDLHHTEKGAALKDSLGGYVDLQIVGTDTNVLGPIDGAALVTDYTPGVDPDGNPNTNFDGTFMITIETDAGIYYVTLADGSDFMITPTQSTAYLGQWYPARLLSVDVGTTGLFSVGY